MNIIEDRCHKLMLDAQALKSDAEFWNAMAQCRGTLTAPHVWLFSASLAAKRASDALQEIVEKMDAIAKEDAA